MATMRIRDIRPGEQVCSVWDDASQRHSVTLEFDKKGVSEVSWGENDFYSEVDAVEDTVLFPEEILVRHSKFAYQASNSAINNFITRSLNIERFVLDFDIDEDSDGMTTSDEEDGHLIQDELDEETPSEGSKRYH